MTCMASSFFLEVEFNSCLEVSDSLVLELLFVSTVTKFVSLIFHFYVGC